MRIEEIRTGLAARLRARRAEIEQATLTRIHSVSDASEISEPEYAEGIRAAVGAALDHGIDAIEYGEDRAPPIPPVLLVQARLAARHGIGLETVLRRYLAGYTLLGDFLIEESAGSGSLDGSALRRLLRAQAGLFDRLFTAVSEEYSRERQAQQGSVEQRRAERVQRLLAGELLDASELAYDFDAWHLGLIAAGPGIRERVQAFAASLDCRLLAIRRSEGTVWAWLGSGRGFASSEVDQALTSVRSSSRALALGEPGEGLSGWRLTHRQAKAAMTIALRGAEDCVRYADVSLLASVLQDDLLSTSLQELYIAPLLAERDGGELACRTLRAYFDAGRNVSSAAASLKLSRETVRTRLRAIEERLGATLDHRGVELEMALRLRSTDSASDLPAGQ